MNIIHSANAYWDYIHYHKIYSKWYENERVCGEDKTDDSNTFWWDSKRFVCRECHISIRGGDGLSPKQQTQIVEHIKSNHFVLIKIVPEVISKIPKVGNKVENKLTKKHRFRHPLKPWQDPDSLFCSPKLKEIIGKEPLKGKECK